MVSYKKKYLETLRELKKLQAWSIDLRPEVVEHRIKIGMPCILQKSVFRIEERDDAYLLYDIVKREEKENV